MICKSVQRFSILRWSFFVLAGVLPHMTGCGSSTNPVDGSATATGGRAGGDAGAQGGAGGQAKGTGGVMDAGRGSGGTAGAADAGQPACAGLAYTHDSLFGAIFDGWAIAFNSTAELVPMPGVGPDGGFSGSLQELDLTDGSPANGSVKLTIPFSGPNQILSFAHAYTGVNMKGATVSARIKLDSGVITGPTDLAQAFLVLKSTSGYLYAPGPDIALDPSAGWMTVSVSADSPSASAAPGYTSCDIREIDLIVQTGNTGHYTQGVVHIDTISIALPGADGGPGDADAGLDAPADAPAGDSASADGAVSDGSLSPDGSDGPSGQ